MGGEIYTDFKSSNRIEISQLVQVLLNFDWFWGSPPLGGRGVSGWGWGVVRRCTPPMCTRMRTNIWHHRESLGFPQIQWGRTFAWNYHVYHVCTCVCVRACMRVHVHMCGGHPPTTPHPHPPSPPHPQSRREPKTAKFNNSWTNQDNSILFEDSLPLNIP